ncbi:glycerophosphoryl diester phosphodiesterase membrane domain-containing protein [Streptomyces sp. TRM66268-LWL]|uniref:Glycerophosphoryl diester phosphodiesterase membrane domain-containing protein n=1 Tax=Streptomyces polyasparticus TaxID=2767826 RepID=A0ABR7SRJ7_9ACTN|nr:glycerophosphoryl diester phosphodiesterase membrane domain-containing protein [Streptomyces polyasparticus]MBC9718130.1 glycerophosphoryl diester phosphodiesterase membrane domain-containing protein [Streptomyces polyasparticus]
MNDTPGWASPGSAPADGQPDGQPSDQDRAVPRPSPPAEPQDAAQDKWSKKQPPAGQWSAPGSPGQQPTPGPQQWGGPSVPPGRGPGWGGGWNAPPAAAKPGVIPLRPLGVGEILDGAVSTMRAHWRTVLGISLTVAVITEIVAILLQGFVLNSSASTEVLEDPNATVSELLSATATVMRDTGVLLLLSLLATFVVTALLTMVTSRAVLGKSVTIGEAWRDARPQVPRLLGLTFLLPLMGAGIVAAGTLPGVLVALAGSSEGGATLAILGGLAAAVVAIWLLVRFSLSSPALMLEKQTIRKSLARSAKLVNRSWWRVFGIQLLAAILVNIVVSIIVIPFTFLAGALSGDGISGFLEASGDAGWTFLIVTGIGSVVGSMLAFPITAGVSVLLYIDLRIRREALDLELARAAGLKEQSGPGTSGQQPGS